jgi:ADP-ribose pyrophosphatase
MAWKTRSSQYLFESQWFKLRQDELTLPSGLEITYTLIDHPGYAMLVPILDDGRVVMEHVYRHTLEATTLECPSGGLDGEPPEVAARRELEEETGYRAGRLEPLGSYFGSSGISNERFHLFIAHDLTDDGVVQREPTEEIELELITLDQLVASVHRGEIKDAPSAFALLLAHARRQ